ncbi:MAG: lysophospholipid acyltransferase family protein [Desulfobaccales bacterium]
MKLRLDHPAFERLAPSLSLGLLKVIFGTSSQTLHGDPEGQALFQSAAPVIFALWHGHLLTSLCVGKIFARRKPGIVLMTSPSRDGEFVAAVARRLGYLTCPGSRQKGGLQALKLLTAYIAQGYAAALVADGSRGPAHVVQKGVLYLARETGVPILPLAAAASRKITFNTWDRFELPLPLGRCALLVGPPYWISPETRGGSLESHRQALENHLNLLFRGSQEFFPAAKLFFSKGSKKNKN